MYYYWVAMLGKTLVRLVLKASSTPCYANALPPSHTLISRWNRSPMSQMLIARPACRELAACLTHTSSADDPSLASVPGTDAAVVTGLTELSISLPTCSLYRNTPNFRELIGCVSCSRKQKTQSMDPGLDFIINRSPWPGTTDPCLTLYSQVCPPVKWKPELIPGVQESHDDNCIEQAASVFSMLFRNQSLRNLQLHPVSC